MKLLLVEDERPVADLIARGLDAECWTVTIAATGEAALDLQEEGRFDIILLDFLLPGISGVDVARTFRARGDSTPILALSALDEGDQRLTALHALGVDCLRKPLDFDALFTYLNSLKQHPCGLPED